MTGLTFDPGLLTHQPPWGQMSSRENLLSNIHDDGSDKESTAASPDSSDRMESSEVLLVDDDECDDADRFTMSGVPLCLFQERALQPNFTTCQLQLSRVEIDKSVIQRMSKATKATPCNSVFAIPLIC